MQSKQPIKEVLQNEYSLKQALTLGAFEDQAMEAMIDDDFISLEESILGEPNLDKYSLGDEK